MKKQQVPKSLFPPKKYTIQSPYIFLEAPGFSLPSSLSLTPTLPATHICTLLFSSGSPSWSFLFFSKATLLELYPPPARWGSGGEEGASQRGRTCKSHRGSETASLLRCLQSSLTKYKRATLAWKGNVSGILLEK